jgi:hypothetical protein
MENVENIENVIGNNSSESFIGKWTNLIFTFLMDYKYYLVGLFLIILGLIYYFFIYNKPKNKNDKNDKTVKNNLIDLPKNNNSNIDNNHYQNNNIENITNVDNNNAENNNAENNNAENNNEENEDETINLNQYDLTNSEIDNINKELEK